MVMPLVDAIPLLGIDARYDFMYKYGANPQTRTDKMSSWRSLWVGFPMVFRDGYIK